MSLLVTSAWVVVPLVMTPFGRQWWANLGYPTTTKLVNGKEIEVVEVDSLTPEQRKAYFNGPAALPTPDRLTLEE